MSECTLAVRFWYSFEHDGRKRSFKIKTDIIISDDREGFDEIDGIESHGGILSFDGGGNPDVSGSYLGISCGNLKTAFGMESDTSVIIILFGYEIGAFECDDELIAEYDSFCRKPFRKKIPIVGKMSIEESGKHLDIPENDKKLIFTDE